MSSAALPGRRLCLLGDLAALFSWRFLKEPPTAPYPYDFSEIETLGTTAIDIALLLIHSFASRNSRVVILRSRKSHMSLAMAIYIFS
ncbi:hypothetical protein SCHPADRAFT_944649 [Schizopora paradoxa]|uniref:Uncharacterized protein n=1 Tax=Schizopora paradoxa TaxID=27342 RepID=A0A0H2RF98_9AGAM|nr:hypothetical protein SCHPADRAFT_944649 [Schizopora paradoxa]